MVCLQAAWEIDLSTKGGTDLFNYAIIGVYPEGKVKISASQTADWNQDIVLHVFLLKSNNLFGISMPRFYWGEEQDLVSVNFDSRLD